MTQSPVNEEPLHNAELESTIFGLRMALTQEESLYARAKFLDQVRVSILAVPTAKPVPTNPDGTVANSSEISFIVVTTPDGVSGVPGFTTLKGLRTALPQADSGMFLSGSDLARILGSSPHKLFIDGPDLHAEVETAELQRLAFVTQQMEMLNEENARKNERLEDALEAFQKRDSPAARADIVSAYLEGFCLIPVAGEHDSDAECVVLSAEGLPGHVDQEVELLTDDGSLLCFSSLALLKAWDTQGRSALPIEGKMVAQLASDAEVDWIIVNRGQSTERRLLVRDGQLSVV